MYDSWEYAQSRLHGTIVRFKGEPVYIHDVSPGMVVRYSKLSKESIKSCLVAELDLEPVPLGFFNTPRGAIYASRQPKREDWRQGLRENTLNLRPLRRWDVNHACLLEAISGVKKGLQEAIAESNKQGIMVAFNRYWAVEGAVLYHKWRAVGTIQPNSRPVFSSKYEYLESRYAEDCGSEYYH